MEFGGPWRFRPLETFDGECRRNCSFVSGEVATAAWTLAPALLAPPPFRVLAVGAALGFTAATALLRMSFGGHYLSDVAARRAVYLSDRPRTLSLVLCSPQTLSAGGHDAFFPSVDDAAILLRWVHVVAAMVWVGSAFALVRLDLAMRPRARDQRPQSPAAQRRRRFQVFSRGGGRRRRDARCISNGRPMPPGPAASPCSV